MEKKELSRLREENAERIAQEILVDKKGWILSEFASGQECVRLHIDRGTQEFNCLVCMYIDKILTDEGYWCEYANLMYCPDYLVKVYPEKTNKSWWKRIFG